MFTPPEYPKGCGSQYWMTPDELADIVDKYADMTLIAYQEYSCGSTEDMCCVSLYDRNPPGQKPIEFIGLYPFASVADARNFGQDWRSAPSTRKPCQRSRAFAASITSISGGETKTALGGRRKEFRPSLSGSA